MSKAESSGHKIHEMDVARQTTKEARQNNGVVQSVTKVGRGDMYAALENETIAHQYDAFAAQYAAADVDLSSFRQSASRQEIYGAVEPFLEGSVLLDVGCGLGMDAEYYREKGASVFAIDASEGMLQQAQLRYPELRLSRQDMERTEFPNEFFDIITSRCAIHYARDIERVYQEWQRLLKPGGMLAFAASHPALQEHFLKDQPSSTDTVLLPILQGRCTVRQPVHTEEEYFPQSLFEHFEELRRVIGKNGNSLPQFLFLHLRKKMGRRSE